ncbi:uncharacterized protein LOC144170346 isoform X2 [Haemaphysalis longicornis]
MAIATAGAIQQQKKIIEQTSLPGFYAVDINYLPFWLLGSSVVIAALLLALVLYACSRRHALGPGRTQVPPRCAAITLACPASLRGAAHQVPEIVLCSSCLQQDDLFRLDPTATVLWNLPLSRSLNPSPCPPPTPPRPMPNARSADGAAIAHSSGQLI